MIDIYTLNIAAIIVGAIALRYRKHRAGAAAMAYPQSGNAINRAICAPL